MQIPVLKAGRRQTQPGEGDTVEEDDGRADRLPPEGLGQQTQGTDKHLKGSAEQEHLAGLATVAQAADEQQQRG